MSAQFGQGRMGAFPPVIKFLLASNVIVFIIQSIFLQGMTFGGLPIDVVVMEKFALWPATSGSFLPWQLLSYQFMHGGISHLLFNMLALWMFGVELEYIWGSRKFAAYYVLSPLQVCFTSSSHHCSAVVLPQQSVHLVRSWVFCWPLG